MPYITSKSREKTDKKREEDDRQMVVANTADDADLSSYLVYLDGGGTLICNPNKFKI